MEFQRLFEIAVLCLTTPVKAMLLVWSAALLLALLGWIVWSILHVLDQIRQAAVRQIVARAAPAGSVSAPRPASRAPETVPYHGTPLL